MRVAIIGAGLMGYWHARIARGVGANIAAIVDPDIDRAHVLAKAFQSKVCVANLSDALRGEHVDVAHICSPSSTHATIARQALESGLNALVEKPLAASAEETRALFAIARQKNVILCPVHQIAFQDAVTKAVRSIAILGNPVAIDFRICSAGGEGCDDTELDDIVDDILPHPLSVLRRIWVKAAWNPERWSVTCPRPGELHVNGEHTGALLSILISTHARPPCFEMLIYTERAAILFDFFHGFSVVSSGAVSWTQKIMRPFDIGAKLLAAASINLLARGLRREVAYPGLKTLTGEFYAAVTDNRPSPISMEDTIAVAVARDEIRKSLQRTAH